MAAETLKRRRKRPGDALALGAVCLSAVLSVLLLTGVAGYIFYRGIWAWEPGFFTGVTSEMKGTVGIAGNLLNTIYLIAVTLLIATPVGVGAAVYLNEYAPPGRVVRLIGFAMDTLSGIPSVIFGLFGYVFFGEALGLGFSLLNGGLTLSLMVLPLIVKSTGEALRTVPEGCRSGALAMGATRWHMIRTVLLPGARRGILAGVILSVGRVVGESAALLFTAGSAGALPGSGGGIPGNLGKMVDKLLKPGGTLAVELYLQMQDGNFETAFGIGCVLMLIVFAVSRVLRLFAGGVPGE